VLAPSEVRERTLDLPSAINAVYAVTGGTVHPVDGPDIERGVVVISDGKIQAIGADVEIPEDAAIVDAAGMHVYPGLIDAGTTLGINEIRQLGVTQDYAESGRFQPDMRAGIAINVDSELIPVARAGGVTTAFLRPNGTTVAGQYSLVQTAGWTSEEMVQDYEAGLSLDWPSDEKVQEELKRLLKDARLYDAIQSQPEESRPHVIQDPRYEALRPYVTGRKRVFIEAHSRKEIAQALLFAEVEKLKIVITGGTDAWKLAAELKQRDVPVIVGPTMRGPIERWDPFDATYANPGRLHEAGIVFCIRSDNASNSRNVAFEAGICVGYGLPEDEALKAITLNAAKILEVDSQAGSLTPGKTAHLIIADGSPLQPTTQIKGVFVAGRPHRPESKQTRMYERYLQRLEVTR
jgi:imidazolonepropionase-like amidohydrolase